MKARSAFASGGGGLLRKSSAWSSELSALLLVHFGNLRELCLLQKFWRTRTKALREAIVAYKKAQSNDTSLPSFKRKLEPNQFNAALQ